MVIGFLRDRRHGRLRTLLSVYIDGQVSEAEASRIEAHLVGCQECRWELESLRSTVDLLKGLPELALPRSFALVATPEPARSMAMGLWPAVAATSLAALLVIALLVGDALGSFRQATSVDGQFVTAPSAVPEAARMEAAAPAQASAEAPEVAPVTEVEAESERAVAAAPAPAMAQASPETEIAAAAAMAVEETEVAPPDEADVPAELREEEPLAAPQPKAVAETEMAAALQERMPPAEAVTADAAVTRADARGVEIPLWQLEAAAGGLFAALAAATAWLLRRGRRFR